MEFVHQLIYMRYICKTLNIHVISPVQRHCSSLFKEHSCPCDYCFAIQTLVFSVFGPAARPWTVDTTFAQTHAAGVDRDSLSLPRLSVEVHSLFVSSPERPLCADVSAGGGGHVTTLDLGIEVDANTLVSTQRVCSVARKKKRRKRKGKIKQCSVRSASKLTQKNPGSNAAERHGVQPGACDYHSDPDEI